jgi:HPt (histidine-containing phosphotransfer) domain-containing protein
MNEHIGKPFEISNLVTLLLATTGWSTAEDTAKDMADLPSPAAPEAGPELLREKFSESIDVEGALVWLGGDLDLYRNFLDSYVADVSGCADELSAHLANSKTKDAARVMHTVKGLSRTVGALELAEFAAQLEVQIKNGTAEDDAATLVARTRAVVDSTLAQLQAVAQKIDADQGR